MNRYGTVSRVQDIAADAEIGEDVRTICPYCEGGTTNERSLSVRRVSETMATFVCYRSSCDLGHGKVAIFSEGGRVLKGKSDATTTSIKEPAIYPLSEAAIALLKKKYGLSEDQIRYGNIRLTYDQRLVMPIRGPSNETPGLNIKKEKELYIGNREYASIPAKWKFLRNRDAPLAAWYRHKRYNRKNSDDLVIVEDQLSALRLTEYTDSLAILGTDLLRPVIQDIRRQRYDTVWLALDNDAIKRAFEMRRRLQSELPNLRVMFLEKDVKDMTEDELQEKITEYEVA